MYSEEKKTLLDRKLDQKLEKKPKKILYLFCDGTSHNKNGSIPDKFYGLLRATAIDVQDQGGLEAAIVKTPDPNFWKYASLSITVDNNCDSTTMALIADEISKNNHKTPVLIKRGNKRFIYGRQPNDEWLLTELDPGELKSVSFPENSGNIIINYRNKTEDEVFSEIAGKNGHCPMDLSHKLYLPGIGSKSDKQHATPGKHSSVLNKEKAAIKNSIQEQLKKNKKRQLIELKKLKKCIKAQLNIYSAQFHEKMAALALSDANEQKNLSQQDLIRTEYLTQVKSLEKEYYQYIKDHQLNPQIVNDVYGTSYDVIDGFKRFWDGMVHGKGREENVNKAITVLANSDYDEVVIVGWSRGGVTGIHIANKLYEVNPNIKVNLFLIDPVAGLDDGLTDTNTQILPPNVVRCTNLIARGDARREFAPQSYEENRLQTKLDPVYPVIGDHSQVAGIDNRFSLVLMTVNKNTTNTAMIDLAKNASVEHEHSAVLIKKGRKIYIYGDSSSGADWQLTKLDNKIMKQLSFPDANEPAVLMNSGKIHLDVYEEIRSKEGHLSAPSKITEHLLMEMICQVEGPEKTTQLFDRKVIKNSVQERRKLIALYADSQVNIKKYKYELGAIERMIYTKEPRLLTHNLDSYTPKLHNVFVNRHHQEKFFFEYPELYGKIVSHQISVQDILEPKISDVKNLDDNSKKVIIASLLLRPLDEQITKIPNDPIYKNFKQSLLELREDAQHKISLESQPSAASLKAIPAVVGCRQAAIMTKDIMNPVLSTAEKIESVRTYANTSTQNSRLSPSIAKLLTGACVLTVAPIAFAVAVCSVGFLAKPIVNKVFNFRKNLYSFLTGSSLTENAKEAIYRSMALS